MTHTLRFVIDRGDRAAAMVPSALYLDPALNKALPLYCLIRGLAASGDTARSKEELGEALSWGRSKVYKAAQALEKAGWLTRVTITLPGGGRESTWRIMREACQTHNPPEAKSGNADSSPETRIGSPETRTSRSPETRTSVLICTPHHHPTHTSGGVISRTSASGDDFESFWEAYPRKRGRALAAREFARATKSTEGAAIVAAAERYAQEVAGRAARWVKEPANWLRGQHWADEPEDAGPDPEGWSELSAGYRGPQSGWARSSYRRFLEATGASTADVAERVKTYLEHTERLGRPVADLADLFDAQRGLLGNENLSGLERARGRA